MLKKLLLSVLISSSLLIAQLQHIEATPSSVENIKVIDIRTPPEWKETGVIKGSSTIMFFDEKGGYNVKKFISELNKVVKKDEKFAIICRTGSRSTAIADFLSTKLGYNIVNLKGGIMHLIGKYGYKTIPFKG